MSANERPKEKTRKVVNVSSTLETFSSFLGVKDFVQSHFAEWLLEGFLDAVVKSWQRD